jgi:class 3 adenylate cyclase
VDRKKFNAYLLLALGASKFIIDAALWVGIGGMLALFGLQFPHASKLDSLWLIQKLHAWGDPALAEVASKFGWAWPSNDISLLPIAGGFVLLAAKQGLDALMVWLTGFVQKRLPLPDEAEALSSSASSMGISVSSTLLALAAVSEKARVKIQRRHARVARLLREAKHRQCAFLSIDVVDAVEMKLGAAPETVTRSFNAYEEMLEGVFHLTGTWKEAWTPDGVMVCFLDVRHALEAAQRVLTGLKALNASRNELPHPFRVRCGLNEGEVVIFEDSKLEQVADHVIDVAGHMQKKARPNSLWLSSEVYDRLEEKSGFRPANARVDGLTVLEWRA